MGFALHVILVFVREMEDNGCPVQEASEAPLFMSTRLPKLEPKDNADFAKEMQREKKRENFANLVSWLYQVQPSDPEARKQPYRKRLEQQFNKASMTGTDDDSCSFCCKGKHPLAFCRVYQESTVNQR